MAVRDASATYKRLRPLHRNSDRGSAETLGTAVIIGVMVTVAATIVANPRETLAPDSPAAAITAQAFVGSSEIFFTHEGGDAIALDAARLVVSQSGLTLYDGPLEPGGGTWLPGQVLRIALLQPIAQNTPIETTVTIGGASGGATVPVYPAITDPTESTGSQIVAEFLAPTGPAPRSGTDALQLIVFADHPGGRKLIAGVEARLVGMITPPVTLHDDGTHGDAVARDGRYSGYITLPLETPAGTYNITATVVGLDGQTATATSLLLVDDMWAQTSGVPPSGSGGATTPGPNGTSPPPNGTAPPPNGTSPPPTGSAPAPDPTAPNGPVPPPPPVAPGTPFTILPTGGIQPKCTGQFETTVIGVAMTYGAGGPAIPVKVDLTRTNGANYTAFANGTAVTANMSSKQATNASDVWGARGKLAGFNLTTNYTSVIGDPHVAVLTNESRPPNVTAFGGQVALETFLAPYIQGGFVRLPYHQAILLYEFNANLNSTAADFQDLVLLMDIQCNGSVLAGQAMPAVPRPSGVEPTIALVSHSPGNLKCRDLQGPETWYELKVDPPAAGTFTDGAMTVTISNFTGKKFDWASSHAMDAIFVKAGSEGSYYYRYVPDSAGGYGLTTPGAAGLNAISHISFCYDVGTY